MTSKLSDDEIRRLARVWSAEAREKSAQDDAEFATWLKQYRKDNRYRYGEGFAFPGGGDCSSSDSGSCDGGGD